MHHFSFSLLHIPSALGKAQNSKREIAEIRKCAPASYKTAPTKKQTTAKQGIKQNERKPKKLLSPRDRFETNPKTE
jgi:hypothetical protein